MVRGLQWTTLIERTFCAESPQVTFYSFQHFTHYLQDRQRWVEAINDLASRYRERAGNNDPMDANMDEPMEVISQVPNFSIILHSPHYIQVSMDDDSGQYAAAANAILGHPLNLNLPGPPVPDRGPMVSIATAHEAAERDKIVRIYYFLVYIFSSL